MARNRPTHRVTCAEHGCREGAFYEYDRVSDMRDHLRRLAKNPWKCTRHTNPGGVLSPDNLEVSTTVTATPGTGNIADRLFWSDGDRIGSGFTFGPGFKAFASDFPEGTRLTVTARVELPAPVADPSGDPNGDNK